jgi:hypothetical protein
MITCSNEQVPAYVSYDPPTSESHADVKNDLYANTPMKSRRKAPEFHQKADHFINQAK